MSKRTEALVKIQHFKRTFYKRTFYKPNRL